MESVDREAKQINYDCTGKEMKSIWNGAYKLRMHWG